MAVVVKRCIDCKAVKALTEFYVKHRNNREGVPRYDSSCKVCRRKRTLDHNRKNIDRVRARKRQWYQERGRFVTRDLSYRRLYNSSQIAYDLQLTQQNGTCAVCGRLPAPGENRFPFDHSHETGLTRGVLCSACNGGLGCFKDNPDLLRAAITYLRVWAEQHGEEQKVVNGL